MHIFDPHFAASPHWTRQPPTAPIAAYRLLQERLGTSRAVVVTPSTYGTDNRCMLHALAQLGDRGRGVAVVDDNASEAQLEELVRQGVRGLRVNFVTPQSWGTTTPAMLATLGSKAAALSLHIQVFASPAQLVELEPLLMHLPAPLVIDHMGRIEPAEGAQGPAFRVLERLLESGKAWVKLSGAYMRSTVGDPSYADVVPLGRALVQTAPSRLVWGSDWPHTTQPPDTVDDAALVDLLATWCEDDAATMKRILVDNAQALYGFSST